MLANASFDILLPALLAGLMVLATHVPLGQMVLERGIVFIDLAVAQVAGLGVAIAGLLGWDDIGWAVQASAVGAALVSAGFLIWCERRLPQVQEGIIGVVFVAAASAEIMVLDYNPHGAEHLKDLLIGQILWVLPDQLTWTCALYVGVVAALWLTDLRRRRALFYVVFAVTITASVQLVGVYLVFASLIVPALAVHRLERRRQLPIAFACGLGGYLMGLMSSALLDWPTGAAIVCWLAVGGAITLAVTWRRPVATRIAS
jgi:zinc/manganese transport system permease protein